jgi:hypothetical protein
MYAYSAGTLRFHAKAERLHSSVFDHNSAYEIRKRGHAHAQVLAANMHAMLCCNQHSDVFPFETEANLSQ